MTRVAKDSRLSTTNQRDVPIDLPALGEPERYELREEPKYRFEADRRDFLKTLGGGIVVCVVRRVASARRPGRRGGGGCRGGGGNVPQPFGSWFLFDEAGATT